MSLFAQIGRRQSRDDAAARRESVHNGAHCLDGGLGFRLRHQIRHRNLGMPRTELRLQFLGSLGLLSRTMTSAFNSVENLLKPYGF